MAIWDKVKDGLDKAGKAAQGAIDEGKLRLDAYRAREQADKAAEALGYAVFRAFESGHELEQDARQRLVTALRERENEAKRLEAALALHKAGPAGNADASTTSTSSEPKGSGAPAEGAGGAQGTADPGAKASGESSPWV